MNKKIGRVCLLLAVLYLFSFATGTLFCCAVAEHDCCGEGCSLCLFVSLLEQVEGLFSLCALALAGLSLFEKTVLCTCLGATPRCTRTLVFLKVKLSD